MSMDTTIKVTKDFKKWLGGNGVKGDTYQDVIIRIINDLSPKKLETYLKKGAYSYQETAKLLGLRLKNP